MHKSPSNTALFFDIVEEEDETRREDKVRRASMCISNGTQNRLVHPSGMAGVQEQEGGHKEGDDELVKTGSNSLPILTPEEVLKELLNDLYIDSTKLKQEELLGEGGFATVHRSLLFDPRKNSHKAVAVKVLKPDLLKSPDDLREFLMEANLQRKMKHRYIVRILGIGGHDMSTMTSLRESIFVVQEYMGGKDLKDLVVRQMLDRGKELYSTEDAFKWLIMVAEALNYCHSVCRPMIIHRDLKLENILLDEAKNEAKLCDFGLHKRLRMKLMSHPGDSPGAAAAAAEGSYYGGNLYANSLGAAAPSSQAQNPDTLPQQRESGSVRRSRSEKFLAQMEQVSENSGRRRYTSDGESAHGGTLYADHISSHGDAQSTPLLSLSSGGKSASSATDAKGTADSPASTVVQSPQPTVAFPTALAEAQSIHSQSQSIHLLSPRSLGSSMELTQKVGSAFYMAPEVVLGKKYNEKVDVFGFAIIMYEVLARSVILVKYAMVHSREELANYGELVAKGHREQIPPHWPEELKCLIADCWAHEPEKRPSFNKIISRLVSIRDSGAAHYINKPLGAKDYNMFCDCGCCLQ
ncbi:unnamed protein product [Ostreobium quekettii]|uniref:Protein kinase domain-containing protein n=1 Tax=Ostreobium quekettii TaxID=121088 RepID=A0A8S1IQI6_9CHLO|nr:unnamed protein product [Ostreobium quekettii]|eukprot:evm.model.scf_162EXC.8 EVM.evm.TU.scf_162EXC.8   scf_162EXC:54849-61701(-)